MVGLSWTPFCCAKKLLMSYTYTPCSMGGLPCSPDESKQLTCTLVLSCQVHFCQTICPVQNIFIWKGVAPTAPVTWVHTAASRAPALSCRQQRRLSGISGSALRPMGAVRGHRRLLPGSRHGPR